MDTNEREIDELRARAEKAERKNKELNEQLWLQQNSGATDEQLKEHYNQTPELQDEFHSSEAYLAYVRHDVITK